MSDSIMLGARGDAVAQVHRRLVVLGVDVPVAELREDRFGPGTEAAIRRLQADFSLPVTGVVDAATAQGLGLAGGAPRTIQGIVCTVDGTPLPGFAVHLVQPRLRGEATLAETTSGADGAFTLAWPAGGVGGLYVRASGGRSTEVPAGPTGGAAWVRLSIGGEYRGPARFSTLTAAILPVLDRIPAHALGDASELKVVAAVAGVPGPDVSRFVLAHKLGAQTGVDPAAFFALFAQRIPAALQAALEPDGDPPAVLDDVQATRVLDTILDLRPETVEAALADAARDHVVAGVDLAAAAERLRALRLERIAARPYRTGKTPFREVLATVLPDAAAQDAVIEAFAAHGTSAAFWTALEQPGGLSADARDALRFTLQTTVLLRSHLPLLRHAQAMRAKGAIASPADLARLDEADWGALLRATDPTGADLTFTASLPFETLDERLDHFARWLAAITEAVRNRTRLLGHPRPPTLYGEWPRITSLAEFFTRLQSHVLENNCILILDIK